jgi:GT2 family glycosyltransferase
VTNLLAAAGTEGVGAVVPLILNADGTVECSVRNEPALLGNLLDAVLTARVASRLGLPSEGEYREHFYRESRDVAWATGAAILIPLNVAREVGDWNETFFLYAEETDFLRRIRERNLAVRFEPSAVVKHRGAGSGSSIELAALMAVNRVRYVEMHHGRFYAVLYRASVLLGHGIRSASAIHRYALSTVFRRGRWRQLPGLREMEAADLGYRRLHRVPSGDGRQAPGR